MKKILIIVVAILPLCLSAQRRSQDTYTPAPDEQPAQSCSNYSNSNYSNSDYSNSNYEDNASQDRSSQNKKSGEKEHKKIITGFTGGMLVHGGYLFSSSPDEMFRNGSLTEDGSTLSDLPRDGFTMGLGGTLRLHLIDHIHLGGEGYVSTMPLMASGTSVRTGWGGAMCDFYATLGIVRPMIGITVGGGSTKRLYVPAEADVSVKGDNNMEYNASFTKTPFFLLDPYVGLEIGLKKIALLIRIDYMLPFGKGKNGLADTQVTWSNFLSPSGPRLYFGVMFGKFN